MVSIHEYRREGYRQIGGFLVWVWSLLLLGATFFALIDGAGGDYADITRYRPWTWDAGNSPYRDDLGFIAGAGVASATLFFAVAVAGVPRFLGLLVYLVTAVLLVTVALATLQLGMLLVCLTTAGLAGIFAVASLPGRAGHQHLRA